MYNSSNSTASIVRSILHEQTAVDKGRSMHMGGGLSERPNWSCATEDSHSGRSPFFTISAKPACPVCICFAGPKCWARRNKQACSATGTLRRLRRAADAPIAHMAVECTRVAKRLSLSSACRDRVWVAVGWRGPPARDDWPATALPAPTRWHCLSLEASPSPRSPRRRSEAKHTLKRAVMTALACHPVETRRMFAHIS